MAFLDTLNGGTPTSSTPTKASGSSGFLGSVRRRTDRENTIAGYQVEAEKAKVESDRMNNPWELTKETVKGIPRVLQSVGKALVDDPMKTLATPVIRAEQALATAAGRAIGGDFGGRLETAANQPMEVPSIFGGPGAVIEPQRGWDDGGAKQILGDTAKYAATVYTGGKVPATAGTAFLGNITKAGIQGAKEGAIGAGAYMGGDELQRRDSTIESTLRETGKGVAIGGGAGLVLGAGGAALARPGALARAAEAEATRLRPLPVEQLDTPGAGVIPESNIRRFKQLPVEDANIRPGATRANARQVNITRESEPYLSEDQLPVINAGPRAQSSLPEIQFARPASRAKSDISYEPIPQVAPGVSNVVSKAPEVASGVTKTTRTSTKRTVGTKPLPKSKPSPQVRITSTGGRPVTMDVPKQVATVEVKAPRPGQPTTVSKAASDANRKLVEQGYDAIPEDQLAKIGSISKADQIDKVSRLMDDPNVVDMAVGTKPVPDGVAPQVLFNAVKNKATKEGDFETLRRLTRSKIAEERATAAQTLGSSGFNNEPADAVAAMREIEDLRAKAKTRRRQPSDVKKEAKAGDATIKKVVAKKTWDDVINSITC